MAAPDAPLNPTRAAYTPAALEACLRVLGTLVAGLGPLGQRLVVVGGLVPTLLLEAQPAPDPDADLGPDDPHPGTNDVDVVVQFGVPDADDQQFYHGLEAVLKENGFERALRNDGVGLSIWQWVRNVDGIATAVEFLAPTDAANPDGGVGVGRMAADAATRPGDEIGAFRITGAELAHRDAVDCELRVALLDNGGNRPVTVRVANLLPFLALKGLAVSGRVKDKDPFDIVWVLNHWAGGPAGAARAARQSLVAGDPHAREGLQRLRDRFADESDDACQRYARFHLGKSADTRGDEWVRHTRDAHGTVAEFLRHWDAP